MDHTVEFIGVLIAGRVIADGFSVLILCFQLIAVLLDVAFKADEGRSVNDIRIPFGQLIPLCHSKGTGGVIDDEKLIAVSVAAAFLKGGYSLLIFLPIGQLRFDISQSGMTSVIKPGRKLPRAVFAEIAVLQLAVAQQTDLLPADITSFLIKSPILYLLLACGFFYYYVRRNGFPSTIKILLYGRDGVTGLYDVKASLAAGC